MRFGITPLALALGLFGCNDYKLNDEPATVAIVEESDAEADAAKARATQRI